MSKTLKEIHKGVKAVVDAEGSEYTATNSLLKMGGKVGDLMDFGEKRRRSAKGSTTVRDNKEEGDLKMKQQAGKLLWLLTAFCEANGTHLDECFDEAHKQVTAKRS